MALGSALRATGIVQPTVILQVLSIALNIVLAPFLIFGTGHAWPAFDVEKAKALVKEAGYDGTPVRIMSTKEYFYNYNGALPLKQMMEAVGFKVDLQVMDWATLVKRRSAQWIHVIERDKRFRLEKVSNNFLQVGHRNGAVQGRLYVKTRD